jgi:hypothetical protein
MQRALSVREEVSQIGPIGRSVIFPSGRSLREGRYNHDPLRHPSKIKNAGKPFGCSGVEEEKRP